MARHHGHGGAPRVPAAVCVARGVCALALLTIVLAMARPAIATSDAENALPPLDPDVELPDVTLRYAAAVPDVVKQWITARAGAAVQCVDTAMRDSSRAISWRKPVVWVCDTPATMAAVLVFLGGSQHYADAASQVGGSVAGATAETYHHVAITYSKWPSTAERVEAGIVNGLLSYGQY